MEEPENIRRFKEQSLRVLGTLYAAHPRPITVTVDDALGITNLSDEEARQLVPPEQEFILVKEAYGTIHWLIDNAYIRAAKMNSGAAGATLLPRAWEALNQPDPLKPERSMGAMILDWSRSTANEAGKSAASAGATTALTAIGKALGLPGL